MTAPTPVLTKERIEILNQHLSRKKGLKSCEFYVQIELNSTTKEYELVCKASDTHEDLNTSEPMSSYIKNDNKIKSQLNPQGLITHNLALRQKIQSELDSANQALYYKELGAQPRSTPSQAMLCTIGMVIITVTVVLAISFLTAGLSTAIFLPLSILTTFFGSLGIASNTILLDKWAKNRFDKKSAKQPRDLKLADSLDKLTDDYCIKYNIHPPIKITEECPKDSYDNNEELFPKSAAVTPKPAVAFTFNPFQTCCPSALSAATTSPSPYKLEENKAPASNRSPASRSMAID